MHGSLSSLSERHLASFWANSLETEFAADCISITNSGITYLTAAFGQTTQQAKTGCSWLQPVWRDLICCCCFLISHWPSCSFSEVPVFFIFLGVFMKSGKMVRRPRMSTNLWQLSAPSGPIMPWSRTFRALVRDTFFSLQQREEIMLQSDVLSVGSIDIKNMHISNKVPWKRRSTNYTAVRNLLCFAWTGNNTMLTMHYFSFWAFLAESLLNIFAHGNDWMLMQKRMSVLKMLWTTCNNGL